MKKISNNIFYMYITNIVLLLIYILATIIFEINTADNISFLYVFFTPGILLFVLPPQIIGTVLSGLARKEEIPDKKKSIFIAIASICTILTNSIAILFYTANISSDDIIFHSIEAIIILEAILLSITCLINIYKVFKQKNKNTK